MSGPSKLPEIAKVDRNGAGELLEYLDGDSRARVGIKLLFRSLFWSHEQDSPMFHKLAQVFPTQAWAVNAYITEGLRLVVQRAGAEDPLYDKFEKRC